MLVELLSRMQFGISIGFHILFPTLNLGLAVFIMIMEWQWLRTKDSVYLRICQFWTKIFALTFGMGVVSGIVLAYQIGTNFGPFITRFGEVLGALFAYETLSAFFLEAGFLGVMLFGWRRVPPKLHFIATVLVTIGTTISAFWILSANSWMQTPSGYDFIDKEYVVSNWWHLVFNPSFIPRLIHMLLASYVTTCFVLAGVASYHLLKNKACELSKKILSFALWASLLLVPVQILVGDDVGLKVLTYQPMKTAAMEGLWETRRGAPLLLFAVPSAKAEKNYYAIAIPKLASLINTHEWNGKLDGLKSVKAEDRPPVVPVFYSFRIMVGLGVIMLMASLLGLILRMKKRLFKSQSFHRFLVLIAPIGFAATIAGWLTAEIGRQPWIVYNLMRTDEAVSNIDVEQVVISMSLLLIAYVITFGFYLYYVLKFIRKGPYDLDLDKIEHHAFQYMNKPPEEGK